MNISKINDISEIYVPFYISANLFFISGMFNSLLHIDDYTYKITCRCLDEFNFGKEISQLRNSFDFFT